ncbi:MAG: M23 family metallopeptidase [Actinomycetes bacterium]
MEEGEEFDQDLPNAPRSRELTRLAVLLGLIFAILLAALGYSWGVNNRSETASLQATSEKPSSPRTSTSVPPTELPTTINAPTSSLPASSNSTSSGTSAVPSTTLPTAATTTVSVGKSKASHAATTDYAFPISPATSAKYGRSHHDYPAADIFATCGTDVVAPHAGVIQDVSYVDSWSSKSNTAESRGGLSFSIVGDDGVRYYGSHLRELDPFVQPGNYVSTGQRIGAVGDTGNAAGTGCHLHFGISTPCGPGDVLRRRGEFWPQPYLDAWKSSDPKSPSSLTVSQTC